MTANCERTVSRDVLERLERVENCLALLLGSGVGRAPEAALEDRVVRVERQTAVALGTVAPEDEAGAGRGEEPARRFSLDTDCVAVDGRPLARTIAAELEAIEQRYAVRWTLD